MDKRIFRKQKCDFCKEKCEEILEYKINNKKLCLCRYCVNLTFKELAKTIVPKSPTSILKKDCRIKIERFN